MDQNANVTQSRQNQGGFWRKGLAKTRHLFEKIGVVDSPWTESDFDACEDALIQSDVGIHATEALVKALRDRPDKKLPIQEALREEIVQLLLPLEVGFACNNMQTSNASSPQVVIMAGINGCGKTTSIAKLTHYFLQASQSVLLAAGDTFRAAAREQLKHWGEHSSVRVIEQAGGDPAAVAFSAIQSGFAQQNDVVLIDTAGRLPTQKHLMAELARIERVCQKAIQEARGSDSPQPEQSLLEVWLVVDGTQGQNTLAQIRQFNEVVSLSGLIVTKLDGSAKGGFLCAYAHSIQQNTAPAARVPIRFIGVGEKPEDLESFSASAFANAMI